MGEYVRDRMRNLIEAVASVDADGKMKVNEKRFEIGEPVWYRGRKWVVADHLEGTYAIWTADHKESPEKDWIPEDELAKVRESKKKVNEDDAAEEDKYSPPELSDDVKKDEKGNVVSIKITWGADDVRSVDDTLTDEQVSDVLRLLVSEHDANIGVNWDNIQYWINHVKEGKD